MPYITQKRRQERIDNCDFGARNPGELNYAFTELIIDYLESKGLNYGTLNEVVGVLECCKLELYRRKAAPYEDEKIEENGDVY